jgi:hypothetical protein
MVASLTYHHITLWHTGAPTDHFFCQDAVLLHDPRRQAYYDQSHSKPETETTSTHRASALQLYSL